MAMSEGGQRLAKIWAIPVRDGNRTSMPWRRRRTKIWVSRLLRAICDRKLATGRSLQPRDDAAPVGRLRGGHWGLQPKKHFATSNGDAAWAVFHGLRLYSGFRVGRREPVRAALRKGL